MAGTPNKVQYGLKNVHYAKLTEGETGDTYTAPVAWPGAVNLNLPQKGETSSFIADDTEYFTSIGNDGYEGTIECAQIPESFRMDIMGEVEDTNKVLFEKESANPAYFALLFEFTGDAHQIKYALYKCIASRAPIEGKATKNKDVKTNSLAFKAIPNRAGWVKANTKSDTVSTAVNAWYSAVPAVPSGT